MAYICKHCEYDLSGLTTGARVTCPECGAEYDPSVMHPFPSVKDYLVVLSTDWVRGLLVMVPLSFVLGFFVKRSWGIFIMPALLLLTIGLIVIAMKSGKRAEQITKYSTDVPGYAWNLYSIPTLLWICVYWVAVMLPWVFVF